MQTASPVVSDGWRMGTEDGDPDHTRSFKGHCSLCDCGFVDAARPCTNLLILSVEPDIGILLYEGLYGETRRKETQSL